MNKAIVFDLDDTLISERDYIKSGFNIIANVIAKNNNLEKEKVYQIMTELFEEDFKNVFNRTLDKLEIIYDFDYIKYLIKTYREHEPSIKFFDDVIPTIKELKKRGYKIGMITDGYKETQRAKIKALNCESLFDEIIVTDELGREFWKPHEKSYELIKENLNSSYSLMTYVADNEIKDFIAPNILEMNSIKILRGKSIYLNQNSECVKNKAKLEIEKLGELLEKI